MNEDFLHFAWKYKTFSQVHLLTDTSEEVEIIDPGQHNTNSGPDFFNAKIKINGTLWVGNVEIHKSSNDWYLHQHHTNKQYNNVILHVVHTYEQSIYNQNGDLIPTLKLNLDSQIIKRHTELMHQKAMIPCGNKLYKIDRFHFDHWVTNMLHEKLEIKYSQIGSVLDQNANEWNETFYVFLTRNMGFGLNGDAFEMLARSLPQKIINRHHDNLYQIEALLFGQAGFLDEILAEDDYYNTLHKEYLFLAHKYHLQPLEKHVWKFLRLRPSNFPTIRLAQLANLLHRSDALFSSILEKDKIVGLSHLLDSNASKYWSTHFRFNVKSNTKRSITKLGESSKRLIVLNTIIPILFAYGKHTNNYTYIDRSFSLLEQLKPEQNSIIQKWKHYNISPENAFQSQALIYLYNNYCALKKCIHCPIGHRILTKDE